LLSFDQLSDKRNQPIDKAIISLLDAQPEGLSGASIRILIKRRRIDVVAAIRMLADAGRIKRNDQHRWVLVEETD
jgi:hypothetical protein